jgi:acid phosphatase
MRARAILCAVALTALIAAVAAPAREPKAPASPEDIVAYHDSGEWNADITSVVKRARKFVKGWLAAHERPWRRKPAIVLDIDDTSLSLYACGLARNFDDLTSTVCPVRAGLPAIKRVRSLFRYVRTRKVAVFFITGRPDAGTIRETSIEQLRAAGYGGKWKLLMRDPDDHRDSRVPQKSGQRRKITRDGYRILANLGDQRSDLKGGYALRAYKLPNPMYFTP